MKLYQLGKGVYQCYKQNVKGNEETSYQMAQKKLTRNVVLALKIDDSHYVYGNLHIYIDKNKITGIQNKRESAHWFYKDKEKYHYLNKKLSIYELDKQERIEKKTAYSFIC